MEGDMDDMYPGDSPTSDGNPVVRTGGGSPRHGELIAFIRYQLSKMRSRNEHHKFEDLCRSFSRQRIVSNVIPATGPVSAGGDQGRDFETFLTYSKENAGDLGIFLGLESQHTVVFCCSLQASDISSKILHDIRVVCTANLMPVDAIVYFTETDVPTSTRHRLVESTMREYQVRLSIIDGEALAESLSEPESVWIPVEYLNVSLDLLGGSELASTIRDLFATGDVIVRPFWQLDPIRDLGVHPPMKLTGWSGLPEYVQRSIDLRLDACLGENGLVVIEGASNSGKTRTAYEAVLRSVKRTGERPVVIPKDGRSLKRLIAAGYKLEHSIVWLDDLEKFVGSEGIDEGVVRLFAVTGDVTFLATLRSRAKVFMESAIAGPPERSLSSIAKAVLDGARTLRIDRNLTSDELKLASAYAGDPRIAAALSAETAGFAEHIAAAPATLLRWMDGKDGASEVGSALISAAVDLRRAGYLSPIPKEWLKVTHAAYLEPRILGRLNEAEIDSGFSWATQMVSGASSCLEVIGKDLFSAFDYLVDFAQEESGDDDSRSPLRHLANIPELIWHELAARISLDDPSFMSCVSVSSLSLHPGLKLSYDRAIASGQLSTDTFKDRGVLLNFVRSCESSHLCIVCQASVHNLDLSVILSVLLKECAPILRNQRMPPSRSQVESIRALASMGKDANLQDRDAPLHLAALGTPAETWTRLGQFMLSMGIDSGGYWTCFAELQAGREPNWPVRPDESSTVILPTDFYQPEE
jgi:hypothetical protein